MPDVRSVICLACHAMNGWSIGSHATSGARVHGRAVDPRERLPYNTVADNGCTNCHKIHSAEGRERLLRFRREEDNCLNCHNGSVARTNIAGEVRKRSSHPVEMFFGRHDPTEDPRVMPRHVECVDCHNPHAVGPVVSGLVGRPSLGAPDQSGWHVSGVDRLGRVVERSRFEYEICFRCHADNLARSRLTAVSRQITQTNTRIEF